MPPPSPRRTRRSAVALLCAVCVLASCHGSSGKKTNSTTGTPTTDKKGKVSLSLALKLGRVDVQAAGPVHPYTKPQQEVILRLVNNYIANAITDPLVTGATPGPLLASFAPTLASRVSKGPDRRVLSDMFIPRLRGVTKTVKQPLNLSVLQQNGTVLIVGAQFGLTVAGSTDDGALTITRAGSFIFEPDAKRHWHITGYTIVVRRNLAGATTTTSAATTTTAAK